MPKNRRRTYRTGSGPAFLALFAIAALTCLTPASAHGAALSSCPTVGLSPLRLPPGSFPVPTFPAGYPSYINRTLERLVFKPFPKGWQEYREQEFPASSRTGIPYVNYVAVSPSIANPAIAASYEFFVFRSCHGAHRYLSRLRSKNPHSESVKLRWARGWRYDLQTTNGVSTVMAWQLWRCVVTLIVQHTTAVRFTPADIPAYANLVTPLNNP